MFVGKKTEEHLEKKEREFRKSEKARMLAEKLTKKKMEIEDAWTRIARL